TRAGARDREIDAARAAGGPGDVTDPALVRVSELKMKGVSKRYGATRAVDDVSLSIGPGELYTLLGPQGAGKTTLLRLLAGLIAADGGRIVLDDEPIDPVPAGKRNLGMVFQGGALWPHLSVTEHVAFGLRARGGSPAEIARKVTDALIQVGLGDVGDRLPGDLSPEERARVALARALVIQPRLLLLDEPLGGLDTAARARMRIELVRLQREAGITTVYATRDQAEALALSTRVAV